MKTFEMMEAHPKEGKCKYKVSHKSSAFGAELTEKIEAPLWFVQPLHVTWRGVPLAEVRQEQGLQGLQNQASTMPGQWRARGG